MTEARTLCEDEREPGIVAMTMALSADVALHLGATEQSRAYVGQALERIRSGASPLRSAKVKNMLGRVLHQHGDHRAALDLHTQADDLAVRLHYRPEEAYARLGLARAAGALGDEQEAAAHHAAAEKLFASMGVPAEGRRR
ncbi:tetratricopeptide repeat protein [Streptomyces sp. WM6391]|nr:tetratricopeptide repeat protein [Streptomyces sp. WM6391]